MLGDFSLPFCGSVKPLSDSHVCRGVWLIFEMLGLLSENSDRAPHLVNAAASRESCVTRFAFSGRAGAFGLQALKHLQYKSCIYRKSSGWLDLSLKTRASFYISKHGRHCLSPLFHKAIRQWCIWYHIAPYNNASSCVAVWYFLSYCWATKGSVIWRAFKTGWIFSCSEGQITQGSKKPSAQIPFKDSFQCSSCTN